MISSILYYAKENDLFSKKSLLFGSSLLFIVLFLAVFGPYFNHFSPDEIHLSLKNIYPNPTFWFGTDDLGRDLFTRTFYGARVSLFIALVAATIDLIFGVLWGVIAAFSTKRVDNTMMRFCDILSSIPDLLFVILLVVAIGPGLVTIITAIALNGWINMARITRAKVLQIKETDFIKASICFGGSFKHILFTHILLNGKAPIISTMTLTMPMAIFTEAFLSFLGLGVQPPQASLGSMVNEGLNALLYYPWRTFFPSLMICIIMLGFNLLGNGLRMAFDPRVKK